jgi:hypothetical protein
MRSSRLAVVALIAVLPAWCQDAPADGPTVGIILQFDNNPGVAPIRVMEQEVEQLLKPSGVALDWRFANQGHGDEPLSRWIVVRFKGKCRVETFGDMDPEPQPTGEHTLASTKLDHGHVLPFSQVQCNEIRSALAYLRPWADGRERQTAMAMALGRVVAHELYHILARTTTHAAHGLAQASQSLKDLVAKPGMAFGEDDLRAIREGVAGGELQASGIDAAK